MIQNLFAGSTATILALLGLVLPHLASLLTGSKWLPKWAGGYVTLFFSAVIGFVGTWAQDPGANHYDWKAAAGTAASALLFAFVSLLVIHKGTPPEAKLLSFATAKKKRAKRAAKSPDTKAA